MNASLYSVWTQYFPPTATVTEVNIPSQAGKVCIVTGGTSGVGYELCQVLFNAGAKVYLTGRTVAKGTEAINSIQAASNDGSQKGSLHLLKLELGDLGTIKESANAFNVKEPRLDILFNNAGIGGNPAGGQTQTGHEIHVGTNALGPFLFTKLLLPALRAAPNPRVIWSSSILVDMLAPKGGFPMQAIKNPPNDGTVNYVSSKTGNWFLASEFGKRCSDGHIVSITQNPGNLKTEIWRHQPWYMYYAVWVTLYNRIYGAYTVLWAGVNPDITVKDNGRYVMPWGRWHDDLRPDLLEALRSKEEGGTGRAAEFWEWCEKETTKLS